MESCPVGIDIALCDAMFEAIESVFWPGVALGFSLGVFFAVLCLLGYGIWRDSREIQWEDHR